MAITRSWPTGKGTDSRPAHWLGEEPTSLPGLCLSQGLDSSWAGWLQICLMAFFGASDLLISLFTCLPVGRHCKERQGKVTEVLNSHSKRGHAHNSGNQLPSLAHLRNIPGLFICSSQHPFLTESLSCHLEKTSWEKTFWPTGKNLGRVKLPDGIVHENCPGWGPDISFFFLTQAWHTSSVEPSWTTSPIWYMQKDACAPCSSLNLAENCTWKDPKSPLLWKKSCLLVWNSLPKKRPKMN